MELFEQIRLEYEFGAGTIQGVARKLGCTGGRCGKRFGARFQRDGRRRSARI